MPPQNAKTYKQTKLGIVVAVMEAGNNITTFICHATRASQCVLTLPNLKTTVYNGGVEIDGCPTPLPPLRV